MKKQIPWARIAVEGIVIVLSILLALAADAAWQERQDRAAEAQLIGDLVGEFEANRSTLDSLITRHRARGARLDAVLQEAGPNRLGLAPDSVRRLLAGAINTQPRFSAADGVLQSSLSTGSLALIRDTELRATLAGFWSQYEFFFNTQDLWVNEFVLTPPVVFETGGLVFAFPDGAPVGPTELWPSELRSTEAINAFKTIHVARNLTTLLTNFGETMRDGIDGMLVDLRAAQDALGR